MTFDDNLLTTMAFYKNIVNAETNKDIDDGEFDDEQLDAWDSPADITSM